MVAAHQRVRDQGGMRTRFRVPRLPFRECWSTSSGVSEGRHPPPFNREVYYMSKSPSATDCSRATDAALDVRVITPAVGAEIHGVQLSGDLPAETVTAIRDALLCHRVLVFRVP